MQNNRYGEFLQRIAFRWYQPMMRYRKYEKLSATLSRYGVSLEILNTSIPTDRGNMRSTLKPLRNVPRMSTYAIAAMINRGVAEMTADQCFVNVGVWHGFTFLAGMISNPDKKCIGVDNFSEFGGPRAEFLARFEDLKSGRHEFHEMDYVEYFSKIHRDPIGFYVYDGEHSYENQLRGIQVAEPFFAKNCRILVDDTNLPAPRDALRDFIAQSQRKYEILLEKRTRHMLHPTLWNGVTILERVS
jgi:hypothetical protein